MDLVDDQEIEAGSEVVHMAVGALVRGDGDRRDLTMPVSMAADRMGIDGRDLSAPLLEQDARRHQAERRQARRGHGGQRDARLAAAGGGTAPTPPPARSPGPKAGG